MDDLPSLNGLRAFEAAARRGSVKDAAAELYVTPGAVSQQLKTLEEALGAQLFRRTSAGLQLTEPGAMLYPVLHDALQNIAAAVARVRTREVAWPLTVSVVPSFASKWLVGRLARFRERNPQIDVRLTASVQQVDFTRSDVDMAIRLGSGNYPGLRTDSLFAEPLAPVCAPRLLRGRPGLAVPEDLRHHTLLHDESYEDWEMWLKLHGVEGVDARRGPVFDDMGIALQAAIDGQGVVMARGELVVQDLLEGRLVRPFDLELPYGLAYYVVSPEHAADWPKVVAFREWMLEEAERYQQERAEAAQRGPQRAGRPRAGKRARRPSDMKSGDGAKGGAKGGAS